MTGIKRILAIAGNRQRLDGGAMYGNVPKAVWQKWSKPDELNRINLACRCLYLETDSGKKILFETGIGAFFEPKLKERFGVVEDTNVLIKNLKIQGVSQDEIDAVVLSHLHFDHAGGLLTDYVPEKKRGLLFPKAKYYVGLTHWERAVQPHFRDRASFVPEMVELLKQSGRLELVAGAEHPDLSPLVTFRYSNGHTPGLMLSEIHLPEGPLVFVADLIPGLPWAHLPVTMGYDRYPELLIEEKSKLLAELAGVNGRLFFTHDEFESCARVRVVSPASEHAPSTVTSTSHNSRTTYVCEPCPL